MQDFVINVQQIWTYPLKAPVAPVDLLLLQEGPGAGAYRSAKTSDVVSTALSTGGLLQLAADGASGLSFGGVTMTLQGGYFTFNSGVNAQNVVINGQTAATQTWAAQQDAVIQAQVSEITNEFVSSFNGRGGRVMLMEEDILRGGGILQWNPHFHGDATAPSVWDPRQNNDTIATTNWVQRAICFRLEEMLELQGVTTFNGRFGAVTLTTDDINNAYFNEPSTPNIGPQAPSPAFGDASNRIATTLFVDESIEDVKEWVDKAFGVGSGAFAPLNSPQFTGIPTAPTANPGTTTGQLATTSFVMSAVAASTAGVASFNGRTGIVTLTGGDVSGAGGALLNSPIFTGVPTAPTPAPGDNSQKVATTAFVDTAIAAVSAGVTSFNTRTGAVVLNTADITSAGGAPLASPALSGTPTAPTAAQTSNDQTIATTAYVHTAIGALAVPVTSFNSRTGAITLQAADVSAAGGAMIASPTFTGTPAAPTAPPNTNTGQIATTAFVQAAITAGTAGVTTFNGRSGVVTMLATDVTGVGGALLASPGFTGTPTAPTAAQSSNDTTLATTAYVRAAVAAINIGVTTFNNRSGAVTLSGADVSAAGGALNSSPAFIGTPTAPTATAGTSTTQIATTQFVMNAIATVGAGNVSNVGTPAAGQLAYWTGAQTIQGAAPPPPNHGRLTYVSQTQLKFAPFNGNQVKINGQLYQIPNAGIAGLGNTGVFVGGVAGQNLLANTSYYIYVFNNSGTLTASYDTTTHVTDTTPGNEGVEIRSGNSIYTLIGAVRTDGSGLFNVSGGWLGASSWFNRRNQTIQGALNNVTAFSPTATAIIGILNLNLWVWGDEGFEIWVLANVTPSVVGQYGYIAVGMDGLSPVLLLAQYVTQSVAGMSTPVVIGGPYTAPEGFHTFNAIGYNQTSSSTMNIYNNTVVAQVRG